MTCGYGLKESDKKLELGSIFEHKSQSKETSHQENKSFNPQEMWGLQCKAGQEVKKKRPDVNLGQTEGLKTSAARLADGKRPRGTAVQYTLKRKINVLVKQLISGRRTCKQRDQRPKRNGTVAPGRIKGREATKREDLGLSKGEGEEG